MCLSENGVSLCVSIRMGVVRVCVSEWNERSLCENKNSFCDQIRMRVVFVSDWKENSLCVYVSVCD